MTALTKDEILEYLEHYQATLFPRQKEMDVLTSHYLLNSSIADAMHDVYVRIEEVLDEVDIMRATGTDLDHLVADRLLLGRNRGDCATGFLTFYKNTPATVAITVPVGTICYLINSMGTRTEFKTTAIGVMGVGEKTVSVAAVAVERGTSGNVALLTITHIQSSAVTGEPVVLGVDGVYNPLPFENGTDDETDEELRQRYVDIVTLPGLATTEMIERHLVDLTDVTEAKVTNYGLGDMEIIVNYSGGIEFVNNDIVDEIKAVIAAGTQARGCHAAVVASGSPGTITAIIDPETLDIADCAGGWIWFRPLEHIPANDVIASFTYKDTSGLLQTGSITVPIGTPRGSMVKATLSEYDNRAFSVPSGAITCNYDYDILIGMGEPGYLYILPTPVYITININLVLKDEPEVDLLTNIGNSIQNWVDDYVIGEDIEWSDIRTCMTIAYAKASIATDKHVLLGTERPFIGIDSIVAMSVVGGGQSISADGQTLILEHDEIAKFNSIAFTIS